MDNIYEDLPAKCIDCHQEDDTHKGKFGADCESCHNASSWFTTVFNHRRKTGFALGGSHAKIECAACHTNTLFEPKLNQDCVSCHKKDDTHKGRNGSQCADCHVNTSWKTTTFSHNRNNKICAAWRPCRSCLRRLSFGTGGRQTSPGRPAKIVTKMTIPMRAAREKTAARAITKPHGSKTHALTKIFQNFPCWGKHDDVECAACHQSKKFQDAETDCIACHAEDDKHCRRRLGRNAGFVTIPMTGPCGDSTIMRRRSFSWRARTRT